jgi:hypothetical protein
MHTQQTYLTTADKARELGISETTLRRRAEAGEIDGALRLWTPGGPWRFPAARNDSGPRGGESSRAVSADTLIGVTPDLMSITLPSIGATLTHDALRVHATLHDLSTRSARAATVMVAPLLAIASRHFRAHDGSCAACLGSFPCADYADAAAGLEQAAGIVLDGVA